MFAGPKMNPRDTNGCSQNPSRITQSLVLERTQVAESLFPQPARAAAPLVSRDFGLEAWENWGANHGEKLMAETLFYECPRPFFVPARLHGYRARVGNLDVSEHRRRSKILTALMRACDNWDQFVPMIDRSLPRQVDLPLFEGKEDILPHFLFEVRVSSRMN